MPERMASLEVGSCGQRFYLGWHCLPLSVGVSTLALHWPYLFCSLTARSCRYEQFGQHGRRPAGVS